jgi:3-oxoacyl-[acyl-carrier protein] reductase
MELNGRVALVTGGAGGIGGAVVRQLAQAGVSGVAINYRKSGKEAESFAAEIERSGIKAIAIQADVQSDKQVRAMIGKVEDSFGRLDIVINNAGLTHWVKLTDLEGLTDSIWDEILDVNVKGAFRCARAAQKLLEANQGMIVNVSSISGVLAPSTMSSLAYGTAKAALIYMTRGLAVAMAPNVRVNCVAPAFTDTPWMSQHFGADYPQVIARASSGFPLKRIATPDDIAGAIVGLITGGDFVTGQTLIVDGGLSLS